MTWLDALTPIFRLLPEIKSPTRLIGLKEKLMWTGIVLVLFYVMGQVTVIGLEAGNYDYLATLSLILGAQMGSLITAGIGPVVLASIILQLLVGGGIININMQDPIQRQHFGSLQKLLAIILCFFEGAAYAGFGMPGVGFITPKAGFFLLVVLQIAIGSLILLYLDEIVQKYGIGSGIGLFIAGGVAGAVFWQVFRWPIGAITSGGIIHTVLTSLNLGILEGVFFPLMPLLFAILIFFMVVYAEGIFVNIPLSIGFRGLGGKYPVKFLYVSNMPVILAAALFANIQLWALAAKDTFLGPFLGVFDSTNQAIGGLAYFIRAPYGILGDIIKYLLQFDMDSLALTLFGNIQLAGDPGTIAMSILFAPIVHLIIYSLIFIGVCVIFGKFWVEMAGQGTEAIAGQLQTAGMHITGFRKDKRIMEKVLTKYIPPITILGSIFVAILAVLADLTNAPGSGTGILLTVGIVYRLYEDLAKQNIAELFPMLKGMK